MVKLNFYQTVEDFLLSKRFILLKSSDMGDYEYVTYGKGNININFPLPKKGYKEKVVAVYFGLKNPHIKQYPNGRWKYNFLEFPKEDNFEKFKTHYNSAISAI